MWKTKRLIPAIAILAAAVIAGAWLFYNLRSKQGYVVLRDEATRNPCTVVPMDEDIKALVAEAREKWEEVDSRTDGYSSVLEAIGLRPCVASMVEVCSYQMPAYSFVSPEQNKRAALLAFAQQSIFARSSDRSLHVSDDGNLAVMVCGKRCVIVLSNEDGALRETVYGVKPKDGP